MVNHLISSRRKKSTRHQAQSQDTVMAKLTEQMTANTQLQSHIQSPLSPAQASAQQLWESWIGTVSESFQSFLIVNFYQESFDLVQRCSMKSKELSQSQQQQQRPKQQNSTNQNAYDNMSTQQSNFRHRNTYVNLQPSSSVRNTDMPIHDQHMESGNISKWNSSQYESIQPNYNSMRNTDTPVSSMRKATMVRQGLK
jgi:hypothetical protein